MTDRRGFLTGLASCATLAGTRVLAASDVRVPSGKPGIRLGVLSDVHLLNPGDEDTLLKALAHFRRRNVDAVILAGDIADRGLISQLKIFAGAWKKIYPGNKRPDGQVVEKIFVSGNHDAHGWHWQKTKKELDDPAYKADCIGIDEDSRRRACEALGEKYEPVFMKTIRGYKFVAAHWTSIGLAPGFLKAHAKELSGTKPFFYIQHCHPKDTCLGPWAWGHDDGKSTEALSAFPNAVAFSGHSHYSLTDERSVWQGAFTSINTASLKYSDVTFSLHENSNGNGFGYEGENRRHAMRQIEAKDARQGMVVSVYGTTLVIERREFVYDKSLGPDWILRIPGGPDATFAARKAKRLPPAFAQGAKPSVKIDPTTVTVSFPAAASVKGCRVFDYEVTARLVEDEVDLVLAQRRVLAPDFYLADASPKGAPGTCVFNRAELRCLGHYVFSVRPIECFGRKGAAIHSDMVVLEKPGKAGNGR